MLEEEEHPHQGLREDISTIVQPRNEAQVDRSALDPPHHRISRRHLPKVFVNPFTRLPVHYLESVYNGVGPTGAPAPSRPARCGFR